MLSRISFWEEQLKANKDQEEKRIREAGEIEYKKTGEYYVAKNKVEEELAELNKRFAIEYAMRSEFKMFEDQMFIRNNRYILGSHEVILHPTYVYGSVCDMEGDKTYYNRILFKEYYTLHENRAIYQALITGGHAVLEYPTSQDLCQLDPEIRPLYDAQAITDRLRPFIKSQVSSHFFDEGVAKFKEVVVVQLKYYESRAYEICFGENTRPNDYWSSINFSKMESQLATLIAELKLRIPEVEAYFQLSNQQFCGSLRFSQYLLYHQSKAEQSMPEPQMHKLRNGKCYK